MNDILAKPFTKDGMAKILTKFCAHLLKNPGVAGDLETNGNAVLSNSLATPTYASAMPPSVSKFETTPINSPATTGSWHSPNQSLAHAASPNLDGSYMQAAGINVSNPQMVMTPGAISGGVFAPQMPQQMPQMSNPRMSSIIAGEERAEKRQRLYPPPGQPTAPGAAGYRQA